MSKQKFRVGDLVRIAESIPSHFPGAGEEAINMGSYTDQFGGDRHSTYTLFIRGQGETSWYDEFDLKLIQTGRLDLLTEWKKEIEDEQRQKGDIDWIFSHGPEVLIAAHSASIDTLARGIGMAGDLWGKHDEGISYYVNAIRVLTMAQPFLIANDKAGWRFVDKHAKISAVDYVIE